MTEIYRYTLRDCMSIDPDGHWIEFYHIATLTARCEAAEKLLKESIELVEVGENDVILAPYYESLAWRIRKYFSGADSPEHP